MFTQDFHEGKCLRRFMNYLKKKIYTQCNNTVRAKIDCKFVRKYRNNVKFATMYYDRYRYKFSTHRPSINPKDLSIRIRHTFILHR